MKTFVWVFLQNVHNKILKLFYLDEKTMKK